MIHQYLMSDKYCESWNKISGIRELIANAIDASSIDNVSIEYEDGYGIIKNKDVILEKNHLLLGESYKDTNQIGQFGEGLKIAALVITRDTDDSVLVKSGKNSYEFFMKENKEFKKKVLAVKIARMKGNIEGTEVIFPVQEEEMDASKNLFLDLNNVEVSNGGVIRDNQEVYVLGVKVADLNNSVFGYNVKNKKLMNRDRTILDRNEMDIGIKDVWHNLTDENLIYELLQACEDDHDRYENNFSMMLGYSADNVWKKVIRERYGDKCCLMASSGKCEKAEYLGYKVLDFGNNMNQTVKWAVGLEWSDQIQPEIILTFIAAEDLTRQEYDILYRAKRYVKRVLPVFAMDNKEIFITEEFDMESSRSQMQESKIILNRKILNSFPETVESIMHEFAHIESCASDCTGSFENKISEYFGIVAKQTEEDLFRL